jgi:CRP-like cAMP-binding protein
MPPSQNELLASLPAREREALEAQGKRVQLPAGMVLHATGETIERVYFPQIGAISLVVELSTGEMVEAALVGWDGAVGGFAALHNLPALNKAVVQIECSALVISAERLRRLCERDSALAALLGLHNQFLLCQAQQSAACNADHHLEARLSRWLLRANDLCGPSFALTQEALAAFLGVRRTSVSLIAQALQNLGIIRYRRGVIEIRDLERLRQVSCECHQALRLQRERLRLKGTDEKVPAAASPHSKAG